MFPLQLQPNDIFPLTLVVVAAVAVIISFFILTFRRTSTMSDKLSKEAEEKLQELTKKTTEDARTELPDSRNHTLRPVTTATPVVNAKPHWNEKRLQPPTANHESLQADVEALRTNLAQLTQELASMKTERDTAHAEVESLKTNLASSTEVLLKAKLDIETLQTTIADQTTSLEDQAHKIELQGGKIEDLSSQLKSILQSASTSSMSKGRPEIARPISAFSEILAAGALVCTNCGQSVKSNDSFCDHCGFQIRPPETLQTTQQSSG